MLSNGKGFYHPLVYVLECHRLGLKFLSPSVNEPGPKFTVHGHTIRVPLAHAKGLSEKTIQRMFAAREQAAFTSLADFHQRVHPLAKERDSSADNKPVEHSPSKS